MGAVRPRELPDEPRLPDPGLAHDGDRLAVARGGALERLGELLQLSRSRPTKRVRPRAALAWSRERAGTVPVSS